jgi:hypothetical protein
MTGRVCSTLLSNSPKRCNVFQISEILLPETDNERSYLTFMAISCLKYNNMMLNVKHEVLTVLIYKTINL